MSGFGRARAAALAGRVKRAAIGAMRPVAEPLVAIALALVIGAVLIIVFSGLVAGHAAFDLGLPVAAYAALLEGAASPNAVSYTHLTLPTNREV